MKLYRLIVAVASILAGGCAYNMSAEEHSALAAMTTERAVAIIQENLANRETSGLGMCAVPRFNPDTRSPRFHSADARKFTYLDNKGGGGCTNNCPDPNHEFAVRYADIKRIFISRTQTTSLCRHGEGLDVIQIIGDHEGRLFVMSTVESANLPKVLAAFKHLNPDIALKNSY